MITRPLAWPVTGRDRKRVAAALKAIYRAPEAALAEQPLAELTAGACGQKYPPRVRTWHRQWAQPIPFFAVPLAVPRVLSTTNAIERHCSCGRRSRRGATSPTMSLP